MRDLIKPTLLIVARLGLFLAVVAWIVVPSTVGRQSRYAIRIGFICLDLSIDGLHVAIIQLNQPHYFGRIKMLTPGATGQGPAISIRVNRGIALWMFFIRHWLIVTVFTTFNIFLLWFYRKRQEAQP